MLDADSGREISDSIAAGMTPDEAACWDLTRQLANGMFGLPVLHSAENAEVARAIHVIQDKILARPTYRRYLDICGRGRPPESNTLP